MGCGQRGQVFGRVGLIVFRQQLELDGLAADFGLRGPNDPQWLQFHERSLLFSTRLK
jgi:hypothetical protein